jgi:hypothetical protein
MVTLSEAATRLGYSTSGLRKLVRKRAIQFFQAGPNSPIKFRPEWLDQFIEAGSIKPGAPAEVKKRKKPKAAPIVEPAFGFDPALHSI